MGFKLDNIPAPKKSIPQKSGLTAILKKEITLFGGLFTTKKKEYFYTELSVLLKAGISLKEALVLIEESERKRSLKTFFGQLIDAIISGASFSVAMKGQKEFTEYEYYAIKIGEETGTLARITTELAQFFARKNKQRRNLISALTYPIIILSTAVLVVIFMLRVIVPMFQDIFQQNNVELPGITRFIISLSDASRTYGWTVLVLITILFIFRGAFSKKNWYRKKRDRLSTKMPFLGRFIITVHLAQFTQAVSLLSAAKVPILNSIQLVKKMIDFYPLQSALIEAEEKITKGATLSESLKGSTIFSHKMIALIKVAEETNQTGFIFEKLNNQYSAEVQRQSKLLTTAMEPLIILFVGILVAVILIAMYLPMFKLSSVLG
ncbi:type II secretion system F family protein [Leptobacterium sp. I13]|uniref:type II secretion system F family protein n=1 Tax=Leptobacterium meishanense TaxID=3128904 RepID=UPI0030EF3E51